MKQSFYVYNNGDLKRKDTHFSLRITMEKREIYRLNGFLIFM